MTVGELLDLIREIENMEDEKIRTSHKTRAAELQWCIDKLRAKEICGGGDE